MNRGPSLTRAILAVGMAGATVAACGSDQTAERPCARYGIPPTGTNCDSTPLIQVTCSGSTLLGR